MKRVIGISFDVGDSGKILRLLQLSNALADANKLGVILKVESEDLINKMRSYFGIGWQVWDSSILDKYTEEILNFIHELLDNREYIEDIMAIAIALLRAYIVVANSMSEEIEKIVEDIQAEGAVKILETETE